MSAYLYVCVQKIYIYRKKRRELFMATPLCVTWINVIIAVQIHSCFCVSKHTLTCSVYTRPHLILGQNASFPKSLSYPPERAITC